MIYTVQVHELLGMMQALLSSSVDISALEGVFVLMMLPFVGQGLEIQRDWCQEVVELWSG